MKNIGVDEDVWRHTRGGDKYVTVILDLTPVRDKTGPSRLLDMVEGRSKQVFAAWLKERPQAWRDGVEAVAMDGFSGFKSAAAEELSAAVSVMDPFHVVRLAGDALDDCRHRVQQTTCGHLGRAGDPPYKARRTLYTGEVLLTEKQQKRIEGLFAEEKHVEVVEVEATWGAYQRMIAAYRKTERGDGKKIMVKLIDSLKTGVPAGLTELKKLGGTLNRRTQGILAYFDRPGTSNGPTGGYQRPPRTPPRLSPRIPQSHKLRSQITPGIRRLQTETTLLNRKSLFVVQFNEFPMSRLHIFADSAQ